MINFNTNKIVILYYPPFAGGRFIANCLALSKHAVHQEKFLAFLDVNFNKNTNALAIYTELHERYKTYAGQDWPTFEKFLDGEKTKYDFVNIELDHPKTRILKWIFETSKKIDFKEIEYYDYKIQSSCWSLPNDSSKIKNWVSYEFSCRLLFGQSDTTSNNYNENFIIPNLSMGFKHFFIVAHNKPQLINILSKWPNALIVELVNYVKFQKLAAFLKNGLVKSTEAANSKITFSMENIFCRTRFLNSMEALYQGLGYTDFNKKLVDTFYTEYVKLHNIIPE